MWRNLNWTTIWEILDILRSSGIERKFLFLRNDQEGIIVHITDGPVLIFWSLRSTSAGKPLAISAEGASVKRWSLRWARVPHLWWWWTFSSRRQRDVDTALVPRGQDTSPGEGRSAPGAWAAWICREIGNLSSCPCVWFSRENRSQRSSLQHHDPLRSDGNNLSPTKH